jgi:hypothetical protein
MDVMADMGAVGMENTPLTLPGIELCVSSPTDWAIAVLVKLLLLSLFELTN